MLPAGDHVTYLAGNCDIPLDRRGVSPYDELVCEFLSELSAELLANLEAKQYSDVISFAFWCRRSNLKKLKHEFTENSIRLGLGLVFHITPSNVPVNFAFSYAFSLLAGNANIVRVPSKPFKQIDIICEAIRELFKNDKFKRIAEMTAFLRYERSDDLTSLLSSQCNARVLWGGDETIRYLRQFPIPERSIDIAFSDRYSFCMVDAESIIQAKDEQIKKLAVGFYNDTYLMDQNACSSPRLVVWSGDKKDEELAKQRFWKAVYEEVKERYKLEPVNVLDKYTRFCQDAIDLEGIATYNRYDNYIYCISLNELPENMHTLSGSFGYFYEYGTDSIDSIAQIINNKYQTLTYFGMDKQQLADFVIFNRLQGIDRIVPIGSALDISVIWDGYDLIRSLSRVIEVK